MNEKLLQQAMALFNTQEKWDAFLELMNSKSTICDKWIDALMKKIKQVFYAAADTNKWQSVNDKWMLRIFPLQLSNNPNDNHMEIRINLWDMRGYLWINKDKYDSEKVRKKIQSKPDIASLLNGFEYHNEWDIYNKPFASDICEPSLDSSYYKWGNDTERVANMLFETYLHPFMTEEFVDFFVQVCNETKINKQ